MGQRDPLGKAGLWRRRLVGGAQPQSVAAVMRMDTRILGMSTPSFATYLAGLSFGKNVAYSSLKAAKSAGFASSTPTSTTSFRVALAARRMCSQFAGGDERARVSVDGFGGVDLLPAIRVRLSRGARHRLQHLPDDPGPGRGDQDDARRGALIGLAATGGVITSAGPVLAGTFASLATIPVTFLTELGFAVAFGILLDTIVVRSVLVTALNLDVGRRMWWPSKLAQKPEPSLEELSEDRAVALSAVDGRADLRVDAN
jgi:MMPL family